jgi:hypothetical protein
MNFSHIPQFRILVCDTCSARSCAVMHHQSGYCHFKNWINEESNRGLKPKNENLNSDWKL